MDLVSIVIPCFNPPGYLAEAIASARKQSHPSIEIILVDDGTSAPDSLSLLHKAADQADKFIKQPNLGLAAARNAGFRAARGAYLLPLDCDDSIDPAFVPECLGALQLNPEAAFAYTDCMVFGTANYTERLTGYNLYHLLDRNTLVYASVIRRQEWELAGGYDESMRLGYEDWEFWLRLGGLGRFGAHVPRPLFRYRKHGYSLLDTARENHQNLVDYIRSRHPELYSDEGRARIKTRWSPSVHIVGTGDHRRQTVRDYTAGTGPQEAAAYLVPGDAPLDPNSAELAVLAVWAGALQARLHDGSVAYSRDAFDRRHGAQASLPARRNGSGGIIRRHLENAGLLSWDAWLRHPLRSTTRLIPLRIKEKANRASGREVFDLSFYLQFRPQSVMIAASVVDPPDYIPRLGQKLRVALITPHLGPGGAEAVLHQIATSLDRTQYELSIIATDSRDDSCRSRWEQAADYVYDLHSAVPPERVPGALYSMARNWQYQFILMQNSLHAYSAAPGIREALPSVRLMDLIHSIDDDWDIAQATASVSAALDLRIAVSDKAAAHLRKFGSADRAIRMIHSGIDMRRFLAADVPVQPGPYRILFAGRLDPVKRPLLLPEIVKELIRTRPRRDFRLLIAGEGPEGPALRRSVERAGLTSLIELLGHVDDLAFVLRSADLVLLTSRNEGIPLIVLEAMACGKPVISSNAGAVAEAVLDRQTGILVEIGPGEAVRFAAAIHQLLEAPELRSAMSKHAIRHVEACFRQDDAITAYRELFRPPAQP